MTYMDQNSIPQHAMMPPSYPNYEYIKHNEDNNNNSSGLEMHAQQQPPYPPLPGGDSCEIAPPSSSSSSDQRPPDKNETETTIDTATAALNRLAQRTGRWSLDEKILFLYGLKKFGKGRWKKISIYLPNRSLVQIKSHAQKVLKRQEEGENIFRRLEDNAPRMALLIKDANARIEKDPTLTSSSTLAAVALRAAGSNGSGYKANAPNRTTSSSTTATGNTSSKQTKRKRQQQPQQQQVLRSAYPGAYGRMYPSAGHHYSHPAHQHPHQQSLPPRYDMWPPTGLPPPPHHHHPYYHHAYPYPPPSQPSHAPTSLPPLQQHHNAPAPVPASSGATPETTSALAPAPTPVAPAAPAAPDASATSSPKRKKGQEDFIAASALCALAVPNQESSE